jgi:hypothetical protein
MTGETKTKIIFINYYRIIVMKRLLQILIIAIAMNMCGTLTAQPTNSFKRLVSIKNDIPTSPPSIYSYIIRGDMLLFACEKEIVAKSLLHSGQDGIKRYDEFTMGLSGPTGSFMSLINIKTDDVYADDMNAGAGTNSCYVYGGSSFIYFSNLFSNPKAEKLIHRTDIPVMQSGGSANYFTAVLHTSLAAETNDVTYFVKANAVIKIDLRKPDSVIKMIPFPAIEKGVYIMDASGTLQLFHHPIDTALWFKCDGDQIVRYNIETDSFDVYNHENLPLEEGYRINKHFLKVNAQMTEQDIVFFITDKDGLYKLLSFDVLTRE